MIKRFLPLFILLIGVLGFTALKMTRPAPEAVSVEERSWLVEVMTVELTRHTPVLPLFGELVAPQQTTLAAAMAGRIAERPVQEGQRVREGELLVALDEADSEPALAQARADVQDLQAQLAAARVRFENDKQALQDEQAVLDNARQQQSRTRTLVERELASRDALDTANDNVARARLTVTLRQRAINEFPANEQALQARLNRARAAQAMAERDVQRSRLTAPFAGIVTDIRVAPNDQVNRDAPLLSLYEEQRLELRARVPEVFRQELMNALAEETELTAVSDDGQHRFTLERFAGTSDASGIDAILRLTSNPRDLRPGTLLSVSLARPARENTLAIPFSALYGSDSVYRMTDDQRMEKVTVQRIGEALDRNGERRILVNGIHLSPGDQLITTHLPNAMTGLKVQPAAPQGSSPE